MGFTKKVEKNKEVTPTQAEVLKAISDFLTVSDIAKSRKTSRTSVYKTIKILFEKGFLERKERGVYGLTNKGKRGLHSFIGLTYKLRQHNLAIKVEVLESPKNWDKKRSQILTMPYFNKRVQLKNTSYDLLSYGKMKLKITSRSVIFRLPTIYSSNVDNCVLQAMDLLYNAIPKVESLFNIKLTKDYKGNITIISQEYARLNDSVAKLYKQDDEKLYVTDEEGKVWLIADYSLSVNELETISPDKADEDMRTVHKFLNDLRKNPTTFSELRGENKEILERVKAISKAQVLGSQAIEQISNNVLRLIGEFNRFSQNDTFK